MARRAGAWVLGGAAAATGALLAAPDAYAWLRLKAGLGRPEPDEPPATGDDGAEATFDTREARLSLRARLNETADADSGAAPRPRSGRSRRDRDPRALRSSPCDEPSTRRVRVCSTTRAARRERTAPPPEGMHVAAPAISVRCKRPTWYPIHLEARATPTRPPSPLEELK